MSLYFNNFSFTEADWQHRLMRLISIHIIFLSFVADLYCQPASGLQPTIHSTVSTQQILIGEPVDIEWEVALPSEGFIQWPALPDSLPHFECLEKSVMDTVFGERGISRIKQRFSFTSFDSGEWKFPALYGSFKPFDSDTAWKLATDSFMLRVSYQPDTTGTLRDIKHIRQVVETRSVWPWVAGFVTIALIVGLYWFWQRSRRNLTPNTAAAAKQAMDSLKALRQWPLEDEKAILQFHQQLLAIYREYITLRSGITAHSKTSGDLLVDLKGFSLSPVDISVAADVLRCCDAVKFARYQPDKTVCYANAAAMMQLVEAIESFYQQSSPNDQ